MLLIDTDVLIWYLRGNEKAKQLLEKQDSFFISVVTYKELTLLRGALRNWTARILFINEEISTKAMFYVEQHYLSHSLEFADALIAAIAVINGFELCTANQKHYQIETSEKLRIERR